MIPTYRQLNGLVGALVDDTLPEREDLDGLLVQRALKQEDHPFRRHVSILFRKYFQNDPLGFEALDHVSDFQTTRCRANSTREIFGKKKLKFLRGSMEDLPELQPAQKNTGEFSVHEMGLPFDTLTVFRNYYGGRPEETDYIACMEQYVTNLQMVMRALQYRNTGLLYGSHTYLFFVRNRVGNEVSVLAMQPKADNLWHVRIEDPKSDFVWKPGSLIHFHKEHQPVN